MSKLDLGSAVPFSVTVNTKSLESICAYLCNTDSITSSRYFVGIVGNTQDFGNWDPNKGLICRFESQKLPGIDLWSCMVPKSKLPPLLKYRYYVAEWRIDTESDPVVKKLVVLAWESRLKPREFDFVAHLKGKVSIDTVKFGKYDNGTFIQRGYLMSHSELRIRLSGPALKLSKNAVPGLSSSTRDLTKLAGRRVYVTCKQSVPENDGVRTALEVEAPIYPNKNVSVSKVNKNSSHLIFSLEQSLATEIRCPSNDPNEITDNNAELHRNSPLTKSQPLPIRGVVQASPMRPNCGFSASPISSRSSTCPSTPRSVSPALSQAGEPPIFLSVLSKDRCTRRLGEHTGCWGTHYTNGDDITFYIETDNVEEAAVELEFYVESSEDNNNVGECDLPPVKFLGSAYFGPFAGYYGQKGSKLLSRRRTVMGDVRISFMVINPIMDGPPPTLEVSYKHYWKKRAALDIGHRGMGTYYLSKEEKNIGVPAPVKENTLRSFQAAVDHGADFIEMDVQLTKDMQVVVYHDFETVITPRKKRRGQLKNLSVAVKDLPYDALRELRLQHASVLTEPQTDEDMEQDDSDPVELQDFPLLRDCLQHIDPDAGFDIEIKYPLEFKTGGSEMPNFFERNVYVDTILREIYKYAGNRRILFSCFDPDTCAMLQMKQIRYPVFQLGVCPEYTDTRQQSFEMLCYSAKANEVLGVAVNSDELLRNPDMADFARELGLIVIVWGSAANDSANMQRLKKMGVYGLIYDRMQEHKQKGTISALKSGKMSRHGSGSESPEDLAEGNGRPPVISDGNGSNNDDDDDPLTPAGSGTTTPSHETSKRNGMNGSLIAQELVDALNNQLVLENPSAGNREESKRRTTLTLSN